MTALILFAAVLWQAPPPTYAIAGTVLHATTGSPLGKTRVFAAPVGDEIRADSRARVMVTASDGRFRFDGLPEGKYRVTAERLGFARQGYQQRNLDQGYFSAVAVGPGQRSENLQFRLIPGGVLAGFVTNSRGAPFPGLLVHAYKVMGSSASSAQLLPVPNSDLGSRTDDRGYYRFHSLSAGNYIVAVAGRPAQLPEEATTDIVAMPLTFYPGVTRPESAGLARVEAGRETEANISAATMPAVDVHVHVPETVKQPDIVLSAEGLFGREVPFYAPAGFNAGEAIVTEVPAGRYILTMHSAGRIAGRKIIDVSIGSHDFTIGEAPLANVWVRVQLQGIADPKEKGAVTVRLNSLAGGYWLVNEVRDRRAFFRGVPSGPHEVYALIRGQQRLPQVALTASGSVAVNESIATLPETGEVELTLVADAAPSEVAGRVFHGEAPESGRLVALVPRDFQNVAQYHFDQSDSDGTFSFHDVTSGDYLAIVLGDGQWWDYRNPDAIRKFAAKAVPVTVGNGPLKELRLELPPSQ